MSNQIDSKNINKTIAKGAMVNVLGNIGKLSLPAFFVVITRLYGPDVMGMFYLVYTMVDIAITLAVAGLNDGVLMFTARWQETEQRDERYFYRILANGFVVSTFISAVCILLAHFGGALLLKSHYPQPGIVEGLQVLVWAIPFRVFAIIVIAATKSMIMMKWDAMIQGFLNPVLLLVFSVFFYFFDASIQSLFLAYLVSSIVVAVVAAAVFARYFSYDKLVREIIHFRALGALYKFALPQNLNMTFNTFITNVDVIMLGYFAFKPEIIGFYAMGAQLVRNIRQIKLVFSGVYAPIISRLFERREHSAINRTFSMISRWTSAIAFPTTLLLLLFKTELLLIFHASFAEANSAFIFLLVVPPLLSCTVGMAGNILVMTGYSLWNLVNSLSIAGLNVFFNYLFIPRFGLMGAALATAVSAFIVSSMALAEVYFLTGTHLILERIYKPYLAILPGLLLFVLFHLYLPSPTWWLQILASVSIVGMFVLMFKFLGLEDEDLRSFFPWKYKNKPDPVELP